VLPSKSSVPVFKISIFKIQNSTKKARFHDLLSSLRVGS
jgi:hypothetical protein